MIEFGTALKCREYPYHRMVVISDPDKNDGYVVLVRVTTDDGKWPDRDCVLTPQDWSELENPRSLVAYSTCHHGRKIKRLELEITAGNFELIEKPPEATLRKIISAAIASKGMPPIAKQYLAQM